PGPVELGVVVQLNAADAALRHLDLLALVLQDVPERRDAGEAVLVDQHGGAAVEQDDALQAEALLGGQVRGVLVADLLQAVDGGLEDLADALALLAAVGLAGAAAEVALEDGHVRGFGVGRAALADAA